MSKTEEVIKIPSRKDSELIARGKGLMNLDLSSINPGIVDKARNLKKAKEILEEKKKELDNTKMPKDAKHKDEKNAIARKRRQLRSEIRVEEKKVEKLAEKAKDIIPDNERDSMCKLAKKVKYKEISWENLSVTEFEKEKEALLFKAKKYYEKYAKYLTAGIIEASSLCEIHRLGKGCQQNVLKNASTIQEACEDIFVDMAEQDYCPERYFNPYMKLALACGLPICGTFLGNLALERQEETETEEEKKKILFQRVRKVNMKLPVIETPGQ